MTATIVRLAASLLLLCGTTPALAALVDQTVEAKFSLRDAQGNVGVVTQVTDTTPAFGPLTQVSAFTGGRGYEGTAKANAIGVYGLVGEQFVTGLLETSYKFGSVAEVVNNNSFPVEVLSSFIVTGGRLQMLAAAGSRIDYELNIVSILNGIQSFFSTGSLVALDAFQHMQFTTAGIDIGAHFVDNPNGLDFVDIPLSAQDVDLGVLQPGQALIFAYSMTIHSDMGAVEVAAWRFQDPFNLATGGTAPMQFTLVPLGPAIDVPAPAGLPVLLAGLAGWTLLPRRR